MRGLPRPARALVALMVVAVATAAVVVSVRAANGDYSGDYALTGYFPRAGEGLVPGSEVVFRGVQVGRVGGVSLAGTAARVTLVLQPTFRVPADAKATIEPVNLFGAEQVALTVPGKGPTTGPYLAATATVTHTATSDELGALFAAATPLLDKINRNDLATVIGELAQASNGEGPQIAQGIDAGAHLASYLDRSLSAQLAALDSFSRFTAALAPDGAALNGLSQQENAFLPTFNQDAADYRRFLGALTSLSNELAQLLTDYHPTLVALLTRGDNVARLLVAQQTEVGQVIRGAYQYAYKVGHGGSIETLPNGSHFTFFNTFVLFTDVNKLVCNLLAPAQPGLAFLEPLQQVLAGAGTAFTCKAQLAAFDAAQGAATTPRTPAGPPPSTTPAAPATTPTTTGAKKALQTLGQQVYGILGRPTSGGSQSLGGYVGSLLGGGGAG